MNSSSDAPEQVLLDFRGFVLVFLCKNNQPPRTNRILSGNTSVSEGGNVQLTKEEKTERKVEEKTFILQMFSQNPAAHST